MIGNTYDNRRIVNLDSDSLNSIYINQTISPKEIVMLSHSNEVKRRPNVAKGIKINTTNPSSIGIANIYRNQVSSNFFSGRDTINNTSRKPVEKRAVEVNNSANRLKPHNPTPRLYVIPSAKSVANSSYRVSNR